MTTLGYTGIWGIGFLVLLLPAAIAVQATPRGTKSGIWPA
jgi:hypothetical protein